MDAKFDLEVPGTSLRERRRLALDKLNSPTAAAVSIAPIAPLRLPPATEASNTRPPLPPVLASIPRSTPASPLLNDGDRWHGLQWQVNGLQDQCTRKDAAVDARLRAIETSLRQLEATVRQLHTGTPTLTNHALPAPPQQPPILLDILWAGADTVLWPLRALGLFRTVVFLLLVASLIGGGLKLGLLELR